MSWQTSGCAVECHALEEYGAVLQLSEGIASECLKGGIGSITNLEA